MPLPGLVGRPKDVVRSAPLNASFSGDSDPVANQVRGDLFIEPAAVPHGITAYTVYLANGTRKDEMLLVERRASERRGVEGS